MFLLSQNDENQSENGCKNSKIRLRARPPAEPQKKMLQTKKLRSKVEKHGFFFTFRLPILDGLVHEQVSSVLFFTVFFEGERHDLSKTGGFGRKMPPPPGKPVTFYECHPEDHAPAPLVRADFPHGTPMQSPRWCQDMPRCQASARPGSSCRARCMHRDTACDAQRSYFWIPSGYD